MRVNLFALGALVAAAALASEAHGQESQKDYARLYVIRTHDLAWYHRSASISVDDVKAGPLANQTCAELRLPPGEHKLSVGWPAMWLTLDPAEKPVELTANLKAGRHYVVRFEVYWSACEKPVYSRCEQYNWRLFALPDELPPHKKCKVYTPLPLGPPVPANAQPDRAS